MPPGSISSPSSNPFLVAPPQGAFLSPPGNISYEIDDTSGAATNAAFCETLSPAESARPSTSVRSMSADGFRMTFAISSTTCDGVPAAGTGLVNLNGASFVWNSTPTTEQGRAMTISRSQWEHEVTSQAAWSLAVTTGEPLQVTDGPTCERRGTRRRPAMSVASNQSPLQRGQ